MERGIGWGLTRRCSGEAVLKRKRTYGDEKLLGKRDGKFLSTREYHKRKSAGTAFPWANGVLKSTIERYK